MAELWMVLVCILTMIFHVGADPGTSMNLTYSYNSTYNGQLYTHEVHIEFTSSLFERFHSCLCDKHHAQCCMELSHVSKGRGYNYNYMATQSYFCEQRQGYRFLQTYSSIYECIFNFESNRNPASIKCSRVRQSLVTLHNNMQEKSFSLESESDFCSLPCVNVRWNRTMGYQTLETVTSTARGFHEGSCMVDPLVTSTSGPTTTPSQIKPIISSQPTASTAAAVSRTTRTVPKSWKTTPQEIRQNLSHEDTDDESEDKYNLLLVIVLSVAGAIISINIITIVLVVICRRRRRRTKSTTMSQSDARATGTMSQKYGEGGRGQTDNAAHYETIKNQGKNDSIERVNDAEGDGYISQADIDRDMLAAANKYANLNDTVMVPDSGYIKMQNLSTDFEMKYMNTATVNSTLSSTNVYHSILESENL